MYNHVCTLTYTHVPCISAGSVDSRNWIQKHIDGPSIGCYCKPVVVEQGFRKLVLTEVKGSDITMLVGG